MSSARCLERSQLEQAIAEAESALSEVEHVTQFQVQDDFLPHVEQLKALRGQIATYERGLESHLAGCELCANGVPY
jgi:DNA mismatch repair ATPase MutS